MAYNYMNIKGLSPLMYLFLTAPVRNSTIASNVNMSQRTGIISHSMQAGLNLRLNHEDMIFERKTKGKGYEHTERRHFQFYGQQPGLRDA